MYKTGSWNFKEGRLSIKMFVSKTWNLCGKISLKMKISANETLNCDYYCLNTGH